ncbi:MAG: hypothetical protein ACOC4M_13230 [Promethearchaeia archaeon]
MRIYNVPIKDKYFSEPEDIEDFFGQTIEVEWNNIFLYGQPLKVPCIAVLRFQKDFIGEIMLEKKLDPNDSKIKEAHIASYKRSYDTEANPNVYLMKNESFRPFPNYVRETQIREKSSGQYRSKLEESHYNRLKELAGL